MLIWFVFPIKICLQLSQFYRYVRYQPHDWIENSTGCRLFGTISSSFPRCVSTWRMCLGVCVWVYEYALMQDAYPTYRWWFRILPPRCCWFSRGRKRSTHDCLYSACTHDGLELSFLFVRNVWRTTAASAGRIYLPVPFLVLRECVRVGFAFTSGLWICAWASAKNQRRRWRKPEEEVLSAYDIRVSSWLADGRNTQRTIHGTSFPLWVHVHTSSSQCLGDVLGVACVCIMFKCVFA